MGALRIIGIILLTFLFIPLLIVSNLFMALDFSYSYDSISESAKPLIKSAFEENFPQSANMPEDKINQNLVEACSIKNNLSLEKFSVPCSKINSNKNNAMGAAINHVLEKIYYKEYDCSFVDCYKNQSAPYIAISEKTNDNLTKGLLMLLGGVLVFLTLYFLLFEKKSSFSLFTGIMLVLFSSVSFAGKRVAGKMASETMGESMLPFDELMNIVFGSSVTVMVLWLSLGLGLIVFSFFFRENEKETSKENSRESD